MLRIRRILAPTDFSRCGEQALVQAAFLALRHDAELLALHVITLFEGDPCRPSVELVSEVERRVEETIRERLDAVTAPLRAQGARVVTASVRGVSAAPSIAGYAAANDADLIVCGTHGRRGVEHLILGSVAEEVIRRAPCPVLTVRERREKPGSPDLVRNVLAPLDFSDNSRVALAHARETAAFYGARLHVLHVVENNLRPAFYNTHGLSMLEVIPKIEQRSKEMLQSEVKALPAHDVEIEEHVVRGHAAREIVRFAEDQQMDLIVIATHGLTSISHFFIGSVAEKVARRSPCPVMVIKSFGKYLVANGAA
jgi:nucleotide-binding universal stress UspA family protein